MTQYLVTGGAGFIGSHIVEALVARGGVVRVLDDLSTGSEANLATLAGAIEFVRGDLRNRADVQAAMHGVEVVFHQGAIASVPRSIANPVETLEVNVNGTQHVLIAARDAGVRRVVYASSCAVYGDAPGMPLCEDMAPQPLSPYAIHKLAGEYLCRVFTRLYGLETVALRYFNVFGPRQDPASEYAAVVPRFLSAVLARQRPIVFGNGEQARDFVAIEDVVQANLLAAVAPGAVSRVMNVGSGRRVTLNEMLRLIGELRGIVIAPEYHEPRAGDIRESRADISLARRLLGYEPAVEFREGLARTLRAMET
jgi:nucleoside-diphosphate-sugar epimerase